MPLTERQKARISTVISDGIDDLLAFPGDKKAQALTALQLMLKKDNLSEAEKVSLTKCPSSIIAHDNSPDAAKVFAEDKTALGNVNLIRTLLQDKNIQKSLSEVESNTLLTADNDEIKQYIREQVTQHIGHLKRQDVKPVNISATPTEKQYEAYKKHVERFISRVKNNPGTTLTVMAIAIAIAVPCMVIKGVNIYDEKYIRDFYAKIAKEPTNEHVITLRYLNKNLLDNPYLPFINEVLPRITDPQIFISAFNLAITDASKSKAFEILLPYIKDIETLNAAYKTTTNADYRNYAILIKEHQQKLFIKELAKAIAKNPKKEQELLAKHLCNNLEIYPNSNAILEKFLPQVTDPKTYNKALESAIKVSSPNSAVITKLVPFVTDPTVLDAAYDAIKDLKTSQIIESRRETIAPIDPLITPLKETLRTAGLLHQPMGVDSSITSHASQKMISAPREEVSSISQTSMSANASFAVNSMLAVAVVLKMCGLNNKFTNLALPAAPVEIDFYQQPTANNWDLKEFQDLLHAEPTAQLIANNIKAEIEQSKTKKWTKEDIVNFVNSPDFKKTMDQAKKMEANALRATEADLGIKSTKKTVNTTPVKPLSTKKQHQNKKGR